ncbi:hypothetical protein ACE14D_08740 [Streptomyces sp. Act-28]
MPNGALRAGLLAREGRRESSVPAHANTPSVVAVHAAGPVATATGGRADSVAQAPAPEGTR